MEPAGKNKITVLAAAAHPDDIEFMMAGTLLLLKARSADIHMWNIASGSGGSLTHNAGEISRIRWEEAQASARLIGAAIHPPIADDLEIFHTKPLIAKAIAVVRKVKPSIILVPSPQDYMEDHQNACRLAVTGAFGRGIKNIESDPPVEAWMGETAVYHAMPDRLRDMLRRRVKAGMYVDITSVMEKKEAMLLCHKSQQEWLDDSQGVDSFAGFMKSMARELGELSGRSAFAEGWRRHQYQGYGAPDFDPLSDALGDLCWIDPAYEAALDEGI